MVVLSLRTVQHHPILLKMLIANIYQLNLSNTFPSALCKLLYIIPFIISIFNHCQLSLQNIFKNTAQARVSNFGAHSLGHCFVQLLFPLFFVINIQFEIKAYDYRLYFLTWESDFLCCVEIMSHRSKNGYKENSQKNYCS